MDEEFYNKEEIIAYLEGEMDASEVLRFEEKIVGDKGLQEEVKAYELLLSAFRQKAYESLLDKVKTFEQQLEEAGMETAGRDATSNVHSKTVVAGRAFSRIRLRRVWGIAAGFALMLVAGAYWVFISGKTQKIPDLTGIYERPVFRGFAGNTEEQDEVNFNEGLYAYDEANTLAAIGFLEQIAQASNWRLKARFLLGHLYFQEHRYAESIKAFQEVEPSIHLLGLDMVERGVNKYDVSWMIALGEGQLGHTTIARQLLKDIAAQPDNPYNGKASMLLKR